MILSKIARIILIIFIIGLSSDPAGLFAGKKSPKYGNFALVGRSGVAYYSNDGGRSWKKARSSVRRQYINSVVSDNLGSFFAVGSKGLILKSTDNGRSYKVIKKMETSYRNKMRRQSFTGIAFDDNGHFVAVGAQSTIIFSHDGGKTWKQSVVDYQTNFRRVKTDRKGNWVAVGTGGTIARSTDNGVSWQNVHKVKGNIHINGLAVSNQGLFVGVGARGKIVVSADGGRSWQEYTTGNRQYMEGMVHNGRDRFIAVGWKGFMFQSADDGKTWTKTDSGTKNRLLNAMSDGRGNVITMGFRGTLMHSGDFGSSWRKASTPRMRHPLNGAALNRLPDLVLSSVRVDDKCNIVLSITNRGPAGMPNRVWKKGSAYVLQIKQGRKTLDYITLQKIDPNRMLKWPKGRVRYVSKAIAVKRKLRFSISVDAKNKLREQSERNNIFSGKLSCQK